MNRYILAPEARDDLQEIWCYIAMDNPAAADRLEEDIYAACEKLAVQPHLGHSRPDLTSDPVLFWRVRSVYLVVYLFTHCFRGFGRAENPRQLRKASKGQ